MEYIACNLVALAQTSSDGHSPDTLIRNPPHSISMPDEDPTKGVSAGTVKYFSQIRLCQNEVVRREARRGGWTAPLVCPVAYPGGVVKGAASAAFIGVTGNGHGDP